MRFRPVLFSTLVAVLLAAPALAGFAGTDVFLPMVGRQAGVHPSNWYTTVWLHNPGAEAVTAQLYLLERGTSNLSPQWVDVMVAPGDTEKLDNVVETYFHKQVFGALRVTCPAKLVVTSRVYSRSVEVGEKESVGQDFAGVPATFAIGAGETSQILGVHQTLPTADSDFRYNFGMVETTGHLANVRVTAYDGNGALQGSTDVTVRAFSQGQWAFKDRFPAVSTESSRLEVEVLSGTGRVIAYGSGLANGSQDPTTFEMTYPDSLLGIGSVRHDSTLAGDGTASAPLGVADAGISPQKIAPSSTAGQVLTTLGSGSPTPGEGMAAAAGTSVAWQSLNTLSLGLTPGGVAFGSVSGGLTQDPASFFWDQGTRSLGLGTPTPRDQLELTGRLRLPETMAVGGSPIAGVLLIGDSVFLHAYGSTDNSFVGPGAGNFSLTGYSNTGVGYGSLNAVTTGISNTAVGANSLTANTSGEGNTAVGRSAMYSSTTGAGNTAVGATSLFSNTTGFNNAAFGASSLYANSVGSNNTAHGHQSLRSNASGSANVAVGAQALQANTTGSYNTASGSGGLSANSTGWNNTATGASALHDNGGGNDNTASGARSLISNTDGSRNTACGASSLGANNTGERNTAAGYGSLNSNSSGSGNTALGYESGYGVTGSGNVLLGKGAGYHEAGSNRLHIANSPDTTLIYGQFDTGRVGINTTSPGQTLSVGGTLGIAGGTGFTVFQGAAGQAGGIVYTLPPTSSDGVLHNNSGFLTWDAGVVAGSGAAGQLAMWTGSGSLGGAAGLFWDAVNGRLGVGAAAVTDQLEVTGSLRLPATTATAGQLKLGDSRFLHAFGTNNTFLGSGSGAMSTWADTNTGVGKGTLAVNTLGDANTAIGADSLKVNANMAGSTAVGVRALSAQSAIDCGPQQSGQPCWAYNTAVGYEAGLTNTTGTGNTFLGTAAGAALPNVINATAVGNGAIVDASHHVRIGNTAVTQIGGQRGWSNLSDARAKEAIRDLGLGLELVLALRPVQFRMKEGDGRTDLGFLAQDVEALLGDGYGLLGVSGDPDRTLSLRYTDLIAPLVKAVQEQQTEIAALRTSIAVLQGRLAELQHSSAQPARP